MDLLNNEILLNLTKILKDVNERIEGNFICNVKPDNYIIQENIEKINNIRYLVKNKKKICEIGVNACHSLLIMLLINSEAEYLLFDLGNHKYTSISIDYIKKVFPNTKINIIYGNSVITLKDFIDNNSCENNTYDICHIDGGHTENIFINDYNNVKKIIKNDGIIIFDDYNYSDIKKFLNNKFDMNEIIKYKNENILNTDKHLIFQYNIVI
jgi:predicted O-methyltransferase YrrM